MNSSNNEQPNRPYGVIVWGATGFTGQLVAEYLQRNYPQGEPLRWAIAGRNEEKLRALAGRLPGGDTPEWLTADSRDPDSLDSLARSAKVVITTVGPYALYGDELVRACVDNGTDYCDLSGEVQWMRRMIDTHQASAQASGARIVHSCGFDSIPSDLGVQFLQEQAVASVGEVCTRVELLVRAMRGGGSGGTIASGLNAMDEASKDRDVARVLVHPYSLNPEGQRSGPDGRDQRSVRYDELAKEWTAPFVMATINNRNVRRSNALMDYPYGKNFQYRESVSCGDGLAGLAKATAMTAGLATAMAAGATRFGRENVLKRFLPKPGEGPSEEERESGFYKMLLIGECESGRQLRAVVTGDRDPGYGSTSKMLAESAICLAMDELETGGGIWTPASAMGPVLRERLVSNAGLTFEMVDA